MLKRDGYVDHENQPFCKACHGKLFGPKGYGYGSAALNSYPTAPPAAAAAASASAAVAAPAPEPVPAPLAASVQPAPSAGAPSGYRPAVTIGASSGAPKCTACAKTVYKPEETIAVGRTWHNAW